MSENLVDLDHDAALEALLGTAFAANDAFNALQALHTEVVEFDDIEATMEIPALLQRLILSHRMELAVKIAREQSFFDGCFEEWTEWEQVWHRPYVELVRESREE